MEEIANVVDNRLEKWGTDERTRHLLKKTEDWLAPINNDLHKNIFITLLKNFNYYSRESIYNIFVNIHNTQVRSFDPNCERTLFFPLISPEGRLNHSYDMLSCYQIANSLNKICFPTEMDLVEKLYPLDIIDNIVLIDDMTGTGNTIKNSIEFMINKFENIFRDKKIHLILLEGSEEGINKIKELEKEYDCEISIICNNLYQKAFLKEHIFDSVECEDAKAIVQQYEKEITNNNDRFVLGYNQSEALMAFYYNTPNNTLSSFWFSNERKNWSPLFPRNNTFGPSWTKDLRKKMRKTKNVNYNLIKTNLEKE